jgi:signal transduction histidine kinase
MAARHVAADKLNPSSQRTLLLAAALLIVMIGGIGVYRAKTRSTVPAWSALAIMVLAFGSILRATWPSAGGWDLAAAAISGLACAMVMTASLGDLQVVLIAVDRSSLRLRIELARTEEQLRTEQMILEERLHDLRNAALGLASAHSALRQHGDLLRDDDRIRLANAVTSELARLQSLVEPQLLRDSIDFSIADVLAPVIEIARASGSQLTVQLGATWAHGHPAGFAQVVQNLLVNARKYAPGARITLVAEQTGKRVQVRVKDEGPGVARDERMAIFARGRRGRMAAGSDGEGLGLHVAAGLMSAMGGSIRLMDTNGAGACFVIELESAHGCVGSTQAAPVYKAS